MRKEEEKQKIIIRIIIHMVTLLMISKALVHFILMVIRRVKTQRIRNLRVMLIIIIWGIEFRLTLSLAAQEISITTLEISKIIDHLLRTLIRMKYSCLERAKIKALKDHNKINQAKTRTFMATKENQAFSLR